MNTPRSFSGIDTETILVWDQLDLAIDQLRRCLRSIRDAQAVLDESGSGWALTSVREIADTASSAAEMIDSEARHLVAVAHSTVRFVQGGS
jgi:hypothetical protein